MGTVLKAMPGYSIAKNLKSISPAYQLLKSKEGKKIASDISPAYKASKSLLG